MQPFDPQSEQWQACPPGAVRGLVHQLRGQRRAEAVRHVAAATAVVLLVVAAALFRPGPVEKPALGGIACRAVLDNAAAYLAGNLDDVTTAKIRHHLTRCNRCRNSVAEMADPDQQNSAALPTPAANQAPRSTVLAAR